MGLFTVVNVHYEQRIGSPFREYDALLNNGIDK